MLPTSARQLTAYHGQHDNASHQGSVAPSLLMACTTPRQRCPIIAHGMPSKGAWAAERGPMVLCEHRSQCSCLEGRG
eukprot:11162382-Lingulodinium_polyedra.AAC.1